ncbi:MAG: autotransporter domain-containing protein [Hyphomicrobiales bacterium]
MSSLASAPYRMRHRSARSSAIRLTLLSSTVIAGLSMTSPLEAAILTVTNTNDSGAGSLRQAILSSSVGDTIDFNISGGSATITLLSALPNLAAGVTIDGSTQPGFPGSQVTINGNGFQPINVRQNGVTIENLVISGGAVPGGQGVTVANGGTLLLVGPNTYSGGTTVAGFLTVGSDTVGVPGAITSSAIGTGLLTIDGGVLRAGGNFTIANATEITSNGALIDANGHIFTLSGTIGDGSGTPAGFLRIFNTGGGTVVLSGANSYSGGTLFDSGRLGIGNSSALGTGTLTMANGTALQFEAGGLNVPNNIVFGGTCITGLLGSAPHGCALFSTSATIDTQGFTDTLSGVISDGTLTAPGSLIKTGTGTLILTGANTYSGGTLLGQGMLGVGSGQALGTGTLTMNFNTTLQFVAGGLNVPNNIVFGFIDPTIDTQGFTDTLSGVISDAAPVGRIPAASSVFGGSLAKIGTGTLILTGANTYSGGTFLDFGTIGVGNSQALGTGPLAMRADTTLQAEGNGFNVGNAISLNGNGNFDTNGFSLTLSGAISDFVLVPVGGVAAPSELILISPGSLTKLGAGTLILTGTDSYTGGTTISAGTLQIGNGGTTGSIIGNVVDNGTLAFDHSDAVTFPGNVSGTGGLTQLGTGVLTLSGTNSYSGATFVSAGTLQAGGAGAFPNASAFTVMGGATLDLSGFNETIGSLSGAGKVTLGSATLTTGNDGTSTTFSGVISGSGGLTKIGAGTFFLTGASTYTGPTAINGGILDVTGSVVSTVSINNGGTLKGNGTVGGIIANSGSTVAPGNSIGTLNVSGNVAFGPGSTYQAEVNAAGQGDKIIAAGTATLTGGTVQVLAANGLYTPADRYTILTANGGVSGTFAQLSVSSNITSFAFLTPALSYDANDVFFGFSQTASLQSVALTPNEFATAAAIQTLGLGNPIFNAVVGQTVAGAQQAFDALSGEIHASAVTAAFEDQRLPREAILDRLSQRPLDTSWLGVASTMTGAYAADLPSGKGPALAPVDVQMYRPRLYGLWGQGFGDWGRTGSDHNAAKLTRDTGGFIIGADAAEHALGGTFRLGLAGGYTDDSLKVANRLSSGDYQSIFGALYGGASFGAIDLKAGAIAATTDTHTSRTIAFPFFNDVASSSYGGSAEQAFAEAGYRLPFHGTLWSYVPGLQSLSVNYEPFLQGAVIHIAQDRYAETALTPAGLVGAARGYDLGTTTLGLRSEYTLASLPGFTLRTLIGWRHAFGDVRPSVTQSFAGSFGSFTVAGVPIDRDALVSETTLDYAVSSMVTVGLSYSGQTGRRASDNAFKGHVEVTW